jgi:hypothetical protein
MDASSFPSPTPRRSRHRLVRGRRCFYVVHNVLRSSRTPRFVDPEAHDFLRTRVTSFGNRDERLEACRAQPGSPATRPRSTRACSSRRAEPWCRGPSCLRSSGVVRGPQVSVPIAAVLSGVSQVALVMTKPGMATRTTTRTGRTLVWPADAAAKDRSDVGGVYDPPRLFLDSGVRAAAAGPLHQVGEERRRELAFCATAPRHCEVLTATIRHSDGPPAEQFPPQVPRGPVTTPISRLQPQ